MDSTVATGPDYSIVEVVRVVVGYGRAVGFGVGSGFPLQNVCS